MLSKVCSNLGELQEDTVLSISVVCSPEYYDTPPYSPEGLYQTFDSDDTAHRGRLSSPEREHLRLRVHAELRDEESFVYSPQDSIVELRDDGWHSQCV